MSDRIAEAAKLAPSASLTVEEVRSVRHWNEHLFSFTITRPPSFRFRSGEFVMIGLPGEGRSFDQYSASIGVRYTLDLAGGNRRALEALSARTDYRRYQLEGARLNLAAKPPRR